MLTLLRTRARDDAGFTLVELLTVLVMLGVIGGFVTASLITAMRSSSQTEARTYALTDLQRGLQRVGRELRVGELQLDPGGAFADGAGARVTRGNQRIDYRYYLEENEDDDSVSLLEDVVRTDLATNVTTSQNGLFIADIANLETGTPLFTYYRNHPVTDELIEVSCVDDGVAVSADECRQRHATATQIELTLEKLLPDQPPMRVSTTVNIRNTRLG